MWARSMPRRRAGRRRRRHVRQRVGHRRHRAAGHRLGHARAPRSTGTAVEMRRQAAVAVVEADDVEAPVGEEPAEATRPRTIIWAVNPMTSSRAGSAGSPNVSYSISIPLAAARGMAQSDLRPADRQSVMPQAGVMSGAMTVFGVHAGLQNTDTATLRALWRTHRGPRVRVDLDLGPLLLRHARRRPGLPGGCRHPRRAGLRHQPRALRLARVLGRLPASGRAGQRHLHHRPAARAAGPTSASAPAGARSSTPPTASRSRRWRPHGPARGGHPVRPRPAARTSGRLRGRSGSSSTTRSCEPKPVQAELPIWVGGAGREADAADRGAVGRRLEHPVRRPRDVRPQARRAPPALRRGRPRPGRDPHGGQRRAGVDRGEPAPAVRRAGRLRAPGRAHRFRRRR